MSIYYCGVQFIFFYIVYSFFGYTCARDRRVSCCTALFSLSTTVSKHWLSVSAPFFHWPFFISISFHKFCALHFVSGLFRQTSALAHFFGGALHSGAAKERCENLRRRRCMPNTTNRPRPRTHITNLPEDRIIK